MKKTDREIVVTPTTEINHDKRDFLKKTAGLSAAAAIMSLVPPGVRNAAWAAGSDAPEKTEVKIGFIPLTDCASVAIAAEKGFDKKYGIKITPSKEASWAGVRDKLVNGELDASHVLYGMIYGLQLGAGGPQKDMAVLMSLNNNGQAITLNNQLKSKGVTGGAALAKLVKAEPKEWTFAQTFPTGTHAMWLYYWMGAYGIDPFKDVKVITDNNWGNPHVRKEAGDTANGIYYFGNPASVINPDPVTQKWVKELQKKFGNYHEIMARAVVGMKVMKEAITRAKTTDAVPVMREIHKMKDFPTMIGPFTYDPRDGEGLRTGLVFMVTAGADMSQDKVVYTNTIKDAMYDKHPDYDKIFGKDYFDQLLSFHGLK